MSTQAAGAELNGTGELTVEELREKVHQLRLANEKLALELDELRSTPRVERRLTRFLPFVSSLVAVGAFGLGAWQYLKADAEKVRDQQRLQQQANENALREIKRETARPLWAKQLELYMDATRAAAVIATAGPADDPAVRRKAEADFWTLYWGPLAAVEDVGVDPDGKNQAAVEKAMVEFGNLLAAPPEDRDRDALRDKSLGLAHAVRDAIKPAFDVKAVDVRFKSEELTRPGRPPAGKVGKPPEPPPADKGK